MATTRVMPLYQQIASRIENQIESGAFNVGDRIYSIREICDQFDVADVTAKKALTVLRSRGVIRTVTGSGAYVAERDEKPQAEQTATKSVAMLKVGAHPAAIFVWEIDLLQQELTRLGYPMIYSVVNHDDDVPRAVDQVIAAGAGCLIVFPPHRDDFEQSNYRSLLRRLDIPVLILETRTEHGGYVTANTERATYELADYLYDLGHRRICLATSFGRKVKGFEHALQRWGDSTVKHWILEECGKTDQDSHEMAQQILDLSPRPTGVIASDDHAAAILITHFQAAGVSVPEDISVVTYGDHPQLANLSPVPVTVMRHPYLETAQEGAQWAQRQLEGRAGRRLLRREITGTLITRDSSGPPRKKK